MSAIKISITVLLFAYVISTVDFSRLVFYITDISLLLLVAALVLLLGHVLVGAAVWGKILTASSAPIPFGYVLQVTYASLFANQFLPAGLGGAILRSYYAEKQGVPLQTAISSVIIERIFHLWVLALVVFLFNSGLFSMIWIPGALEISSILVVGIVPLFVASAISFVERLGALGRGVIQISCNLHSLLSPRYAFYVLAYTLAWHLLSLGAIWALSFGLNAGIAITTFLPIASVALLLSALPISINGWGVREAAIVYMFNRAGLSPEIGITVSIIFGILVTLSRLPGGLIFLSLRAPKPVNE